MSKSIRRILVILLVAQLIIPYSTFAAAVGEFTSTAGTVSQTRGKEVITPAVKSSIELSDLIATDRASSASMAFTDDSTIILSESSKLEIKEFLFKDQLRRGVFSLAIGKLTAKVQKFIGGDNVFEINSPTAGVGVRGTGFEFIEGMRDENTGAGPADQRMATVSCTDGSLNLSAFSDTGAVTSTAILEAGQTAVIVGGVITISLIGAAAVAAIAKTTETGAAGAAGGAGTGASGTAAAGGGAATAATAGTAAAATGMSTAAIAGIAIGGAAVLGGAAAAAGGGGGGSEAAVKTSPYQGVIGGSYTSSACYSGTFTMNISSSGGVTGTYTRAGATFNDLSGSVVGNGQYSGVAGSCTWVGTINVAGGTLSGIGTWDCGAGCGGSWSGSNTGSVTIRW